MSSYIKRLRNGITALRECDALPQGRGLGRSEFERACQILVQRLYGDADQEDWELPESLAGHIVNNLALCHDIAKAIDAIDAKAAGIDLVMLKMDDDDLTALGAALLGKKAEQEGGIRARLPINGCMACPGRAWRRACLLLGVRRHPDPQSTETRSCGLSCVRLT